MQRWPARLFLLAGVAAVGVAIPAFSQDVPESILPPGFEEPQQRPEAQPAPTIPSAGTPVRAPVSSLPPSETSTQITPEELEQILASIPPPIEIPDEARRPIDPVGPLTNGSGGLGDNAWGDNGRFLSSLMRRVDAPLPSRWASILLRRALLTRAPAPAGVNPVDWVAERAWLLLRMGEADGARMLVQAVDVDKFTPKMFSVAVQTALATADPAALCPLIEGGRRTSDEAVWGLSDAVCAALAGEASRASLLIDQARRRGLGQEIDLLLAEKVIGGGTNTRRAVTIQWDDVDALNTWRFGLAAATGLDIPAPLMADAGLTMQAWRARAPMIPIEQRTQAAETAASLGVFSNAALVEMYSLIADTTDITELAGSVGGRLRTAYAARSPNQRVEAIRALWDEADDPRARYARHILTAVAASRIDPSEQVAGQAPGLIHSTLSAGIDGELNKWTGTVEGLDGGARSRAWALLALGSPDPQVDIDGGEIADFMEADDSQGKYRSRLLIAALAGLGRIDLSDAESLAEDMDFQLGRQDAWTQALNAAVRGRNQGSVALLAAAAMQTPHWRGVPAPHFFRIISALRQVGLEYEARMIAAEAVGRM